MRLNSAEMRIAFQVRMSGEQTKACKPALKQKAYVSTEVKPTLKQKTYQCRGSQFRNLKGMK